MKKLFAIMLTIVILFGMMMVPVSASSAGKIGTDKAEYLEGEMIKMYYEFPSKDADRQIWVYKGSVAEENRVWVISATGLENEGYHILFWPENTLATPGDYIMKVMKKNGDAYSADITATFKVKSNPNLTRTLSISLDKTMYNIDDTIVISYNGVTDALPNKTVQVTIYDEVGIPATDTPVYLWDTRTFNGISGTIEIDMTEMDFWAGNYYAIIESADPEADYSYSKIEFTVADYDLATDAPADETETPADPTEAPATQAPVTDAPATDAPVEDITEAPATPDATEIPEKDNQGGNNTVLFVVIGIAAALLVALVVVVILLIKKKK